MQTMVFGRSALYIVISGITGIFAGRHLSPLPPSALKNEPLEARDATGAVVSSGFLPQQNQNSGKDPKVDSSRPNLADDVEGNLNWLLSNIDENRDFQKIGSELADWIAANPDEAVAFLSGSSNRDAAFSSLFGLWAKKDPHTASLWLSKHPDAPGRDGMVAGLATGVARVDPSAAIQWVAAIKDPVIKLNAGQEAGWVIYRSSEADAEAGLLETGIPESVIPSIKAGWQKRFSAMVSRHAQDLVSMAKVAAAAGATINAMGVEDVVTHLSTGVSGGGQFKESMFMVDTTDWTLRELSAAKKKMSVIHGFMGFDP